MTEFRLREMRKRAGMKQQELAALIGCNNARISDYERGIQVPSLTRAANIAIALGCSLDELAGIAQDEEGMRA